ncbi:MAG: ABC transporter ATP-binding protein, partial [Steroidobacteraceae bacterium]
MSLVSHSRRRSAHTRPELTRGFLGVFAYSHRALQLVWTTSRSLTIAFAILTLIAGTLPAAVAYVGALIVDAVVAAIQADA